MARLGDICTFQSGGTPAKNDSSFFGGEIPWITTVALNGGIICEADAVDWITKKAIEHSAAKIVPTHSIMVGTRVGVGKVAINDVPMSTSQDIISLLNIDEMVWDKTYLCKVILSKNSYLSSQARGATIKGIKIDTLAMLEIPDLPIKEQKRISAVLDRVSDLIFLRKQQLQKLDELVKARFVELFDGKYATKTLESVCEELFAGGDVKKDISSDVQSEEHPYPIYTNGEKNNGLYGYTSKARVTKEAVTISGRGTIGFTCLRKEPFYPAVRLIVAVPNQELVSGCYLQHFVQSKNYGGQGASIPQLTVPMIKDEPIPVPPIELQNQFAAFVEQTDKSKLTVQQSLDKLEILKKSLMQKYFG